MPVFKPQEFLISAVTKISQNAEIKFKFLVKQHISFTLLLVVWQLKGSEKEPNMFHNYETEKITRRASDTAEYIELFDFSTRDHHRRCI